tara:strand:+ start:2021 stop:2416 length:396 start_codon:yes stop_codon:yes gene_type:complete
MEKFNLENTIGIAALLVHAAKIDENYSEKEKDLIRSFILKITNNTSAKNEILQKAEKLEADSNQLLNFTNIIKKNSIESKAKIIEELWKIIISDDSIDQFESNLMRRICGLIYFPDKLNGEIKIKLLKERI